MLDNKLDRKVKQTPCYQCEGKGYTEIRDCGGEIQRTETCSFCEGQGYISQYVDGIGQVDLNARPHSRINK